MSSPKKVVNILNFIFLFLQFLMAESTLMIKAGENLPSLTISTIQFVLYQTDNFFANTIQ